MKILLTGATGYIGKRLLPILLGNGHEVVCCVRDRQRFHYPDSKKVQVIEIDLLDKASLEKIPKDIDGAYYLVHSMASSTNYHALEQQSALNFREAISNTNVVHLIYLSGIINEDGLSDHLESRRNVEVELGKGKYHLTTLRAGIVIGSGSASFEIIRDLVEKLPYMITPKWLRTKCQPIAISDVLKFLAKSLFNESSYDKDFDIGGPDILSYKEMLLGYAKARGLKRRISIVPVMTPKLSSYWLYFVTSTSYKLATALVDSMKIEVVCRDDKLARLLKIETIGYQESLNRALARINNNEIESSWKDSFVSSGLEPISHESMQVPTFGCFIDKRKRRFNDRQECIDRVWRIGGENGWYYADWLWELRGYMDILAGGVGLRRGRTNKNVIGVGDALDFWRVYFADKENGRLILFAEMKVPGEAWLEFSVEGNFLVQTATFRPKGLSGRLYWYSVYLFHGIIFSGLLKKLTNN